MKNNLIYNFSISLDELIEKDFTFNLLNSYKTLKLIGYNNNYTQLTKEHILKLSLFFDIYDFDIKFIDYFYENFLKDKLNKKGFEKIDVNYEKFTYGCNIEFVFKRHLTYLDFLNLFKINDLFKKLINNEYKDVIEFNISFINKSFQTSNNITIKKTKITIYEIKKRNNDDNKLSFLSKIEIFIENECIEKIIIKYKSRSFLLITIDLINNYVNIDFNKEKINISNKDYIDLFKNKTLNYLSNNLLKYIKGQKSLIKDFINYIKKDVKKIELINIIV